MAQERHTFAVAAPRPRAVTAAGAAAAAAVAAAVAAAPLASIAQAPLALQALACCVLLAALLLFAAQTVQESVEVLPGVGVVLRTRRRGGGGRCALLDAERIRCVVINEAVTTTDVHYYLAFVLHGATELAVAFPTLLPRLEVLQPIYREVHALLEGRPP